MAKRNPQPAVARALYRAKQAALDGHNRYIWNSKGVLKVTKKEPPNKERRQYWVVTPGGSARLQLPAPVKVNPRRSPSRRANSATFRSFEHASMAARAYPSSTGWKTEARYPTKQAARLGAVDFAHKGRHQSGTIRIVEIREPRVEYVVKYKPKGIGKANPRRKATRSRNPQWEVVRGSRKVITWANTARGPFESRLYVNNGETATLTHARHKTLEGARKWAAKTLDTHIARATPRMGPVRVSSNPHSFHDARVRLTRKGEVKIAIHNPSSAAAFLKVMGRRKNGAVTGNPWDREQFISRAKDLEHAGYVRLGLNYTKAQAQKIIKAQRAKGNNARLMPYPSKTGGTKYGVWVQY